MIQAEEHVSVEESDYLCKKCPDSSVGDSGLLHAGLTDKNNDLMGLLERMNLSVVEQEGTTPYLNRIKTSQFTYRFRKLEEKLV